MSALYVVRDGDRILTAPEGVEYSIATVVLMGALVSGGNPEIFPAGSEPVEPPRRRNVRISLEISVDAEKASALPGFDGFGSLEPGGEVDPPQDGFTMEAELLESSIIRLVSDLWRARLDALIEESHVEVGCVYEDASDTF